MKNVKLLSVLSSMFLLFSGCGNWFDSFISTKEKIANSGGSGGLTIDAPTKAIDSTNLYNFLVQGNCRVGDSLKITFPGFERTEACSGAGTWSSLIDLGGNGDGTVDVIVASVSDPTVIANLQLIKTTMSCPGGPTTFSTNMNARHVIGQADFVSNTANRGGVVAANTLNNPIGLVVNNGRLYIADAGNNRVLVYNTLPTSNGGNADQVIGQANFASSASGTSEFLMNGIQQIAVVGNYLAVGEWTNARISLWPLSNPVSASYFLGQPNATSNTNTNGGVTAQSLGAVVGMAAHGTKLYAGDVTNSRVMVFETANLSNFKNASMVLGQGNFTSNAMGGGLTGFGIPYGVSTDGTHLAIMDNNGERIMIYNSMPNGDGAAADLAWGSYGINSQGTNNAVGLFIGDNKMFIADRGSDRVLVFNSIPTTSNQPADAVLGQSIFTSDAHNQCNCATAAANTLWGVHQAYWDGCRLYVTDKQNNRVLVY